MMRQQVESLMQKRDEIRKEVIVKDKRIKDLEKILS